MGAARQMMYDLALQRWEYSGKLGDFDIHVYHNGTEYRLPKYLETKEQMLDKYPMKTVLVDANRFSADVVGKIIGINFTRGLWILEIDGEIEIFPGKPGFKPVAYHP